MLRKIECIRSLFPMRHQYQDQLYLNQANLVFSLCHSSSAHRMLPVSLLLECPGDVENELWLESAMNHGHLQVSISLRIQAFSYLCFQYAVFRLLN